jgi:hypothetical protein
MLSENTGVPDDGRAAVQVRRMLEAESAES